MVASEYTSGSNISSSGQQLWNQRCFAKPLLAAQARSHHAIEDVITLNQSHIMD
jgi:hypothetical protein